MTASSDDPESGVASYAYPTFGFGWSNTARPNLANKAGLPAYPFQSKDWKGGSAE